jgi:hypothetical protein
VEEKKTLNIGTQTIDLDSLLTKNREELIKILENIYFDGYQQALKSVENKISENIEQLISIKKEVGTKQEQTVEPKNETPAPIQQTVNDGKIEIKITDEPVEQDPLKKRMNEIAGMVYKFSKPGWVIYRYNGTEDEYLKNKFGFTTLPMKALVFDTEQEALAHKEHYWGSGYDELFIRKV